MSSSDNRLDAASQAIMNLVLGQDPRAEGMMPGWAIEIARQKLLFFTTPAEFAARFDGVVAALCDAFEEGDWFDYPLEHDFGWWDGEAFRATEPDMLDDPKENAIRIVSCTGGPHSEIIVTDDDRVFVKGYWGTTSVSLGPVHADGIHYSTLEMFS